MCIPSALPALRPDRINAVPRGSMENRSPLASQKHEAAGRYETQKILASTTAGLSTELSIDWHGSLVFVMVGFPPHAYLENLAVPSFSGLRILSITI